MLYGNDAANDLDGSGGADTMTGGFGDDRYFVNESMDVVIESEVDGGTRDEIITAASLTLKDDQFIELLTGSFGNINLTGNKFDNIITGTTEANILSGMDGNDTIEGGAGVDLIMGGNDNDILRGGGQKDRLVGGDGIDQLFGDAGNDTLEGGFGRDIMTGGDGHDRFAFSAAGHSVAGNSDEIDKFSRSGDSRDYIMLETMDANTRTPKHDKFDFIGSSGYSKNNTGEVRVVKSGGDCLVMADVDGDRQTDFVLLVNDVNKLVEADFIL
jgi:Ca2+-binding RTX toxin-like protein